MTDLERMIDAAAVLVRACAEIDRLGNALSEIANMPEDDDGFNPRTMQRLARQTKPEQIVKLNLSTLKWWRELVDLNPQDLAPRMDEIIKRHKEG